MFKSVVVGLLLCLLPNVTARHLQQLAKCPLAASTAPDLTEVAVDCGTTADCLTCGCALTGTFAPAILGLSSKAAAEPDVSSLVGTSADISSISLSSSPAVDLDQLAATLEACIAKYSTALVLAGADPDTLIGLNSCAAQRSKCLAKSVESSAAGSAVDSLGSDGLSTTLPGIKKNATAANCTLTSKLYVKPDSVTTAEDIGLEFVLMACPGQKSAGRRFNFTALDVLEAMLASSELVGALASDQASALETLYQNISSPGFNAGRREGLDVYVAANIELGVPVGVNRILDDFKMIGLPDDAVSGSQEFDIGISPAPRPSLSQRSSLRATSTAATTTRGGSIAAATWLGFILLAVSL